MTKIISQNSLKYKKNIVVLFSERRPDVNLVGGGRSERKVEERQFFSITLENAGRQPDEQKPPIQRRKR